MDIWKAITYVASPLTLVAFLAAVIAWVYVTQIKRIEALIGKAKDSDRKILLEGVLDVMRVNTDRLSQTQRYDLAIQLLHGRRLKLKLAFGAFLVLAIGLLALSAFAIYQQPPDKTIKDILAGERKSEAIKTLKGLDIYPISDSELPSALGNLVDLQKNETGLSPIEKTERQQNRIDQNPSISELRRRAQSGAPPFQRLGMKLIAGVPRIGPDQPSRYFVHVPIGSDFAWQRVRVLYPATNREIVVIAQPAIDDQLRAVDLHLNYRQAEHLFGSQLLTKTTKIWIQVLNPGNLYDPSCEPARNQSSRKGKEEQCDKDEIRDSTSMLRSRRS